MAVVQEAEPRRAEGALRAQGGVRGRAPARRMPYPAAR